MAESLTGKVALVTGASSGIGMATAVALARAGARVALVARRADRLADCAAQIAATGGASLQFAADVTDLAQVQAVVQQTHEHWGRLDMLVNNAGVMLLGKIVGADITDWDRMVKINLLGLMYMTHAVLPHMLAQGGGDIIMVSSVAGRVAGAGRGVYNATKFAVGAFSEALRQEVTGRNVRVTLIEPGAVNTELTSHITDPAAKLSAEELYRSVDAMTSEDIAESILFALTRPARMSVNEILMRPTKQER